MPNNSGPMPVAVRQVGELYVFSPYMVFPSGVSLFSPFYHRKHRHINKLFGDN